MPRYLSQYPLYKLQVRPQRQKALGDGGIEVTQEPLYAEFQPFYDGGMVFENEETAALKHFGFRGNTQEADQATPSNPLLRLSIFDTDEMAKRNGWDEETQALIEAKLDDWASQCPDEILKVTTTPIQPPYPNWDEDDRPPEQLIVRLQEDGYDFENVLYYEKVFGRNRPDVVAALELAIENTRAEQVMA
jgi:hypothetical protein